MTKAADISAADRTKVETMAGLGMTDAHIALVIGIGEATLQRRCRTELGRGRARASMAVSQTLFRLATSGRCVAATIFWKKCRDGWREVQRIENVTGDPKQLAIE
jgi:hypothetical protein